MKLTMSLGHALCWSMTSISNLIVHFLLYNSLRDLRYLSVMITHLGTAASEVAEWSRCWFVSWELALNLFEFSLTLWMNIQYLGEAIPIISACSSSLELAAGSNCCRLYSVLPSQVLAFPPLVLYFQFIVFFGFVDVLQHRWFQFDVIELWFLTKFLLYSNFFRAFPLIAAYLPRRRKLIVRKSSMTFKI